MGISFEIPEVTTQEIANCTLKLLEICRDQDSQPKVYLACSSEIFGNSSLEAQNEDSLLNPTSPYGVAKAFCLHTGRIYRESMNFLFVMASSTTTSLHAVVKILLLKKLFELQQLLKENQIT